MLVDRGCRRIATIAGPAGHDGRRRPARRASAQAMSAAGLPADAVAFGDFTEASGEAAARELLARATPTSTASRSPRT